MHYQQIVTRTRYWKQTFICFVHFQLNEAESAKLKNEKEHSEKSAQFVLAEQKLHFLEKELRRNINKSRPYFEQKDGFQAFLQHKKRSIESLQKKIQFAKRQYADALNNLEEVT